MGDKYPPRVLPRPDLEPGGIPGALAEARTQPCGPVPCSGCDDREEWCGRKPCPNFHGKSETGQPDEPKLRDPVANIPDETGIPSAAEDRAALAEVMNNVEAFIRADERAKTLAEAKARVEERGMRQASVGFHDGIRAALTAIDGILPKKGGLPNKAKGVFEAKDGSNP
jgi:hypothetical protein